MSNQTLGAQGEDRAAAYLTARGCIICERNFRVKSGEIDIIADDRGTLVFVEVKTRTGTQYGTPAQAVDFRKRNKIIQTAYWYLRQRQIDNRPCRFDVIEVYAVRGDWQVRHIKGAFEA
ncbi:TIGR00252 family protein [Selenomonas sp. oral taxon 137 str. F0430]|uniref:YraN family protein n=1 Tax=Selenomonas sp. oral taxon 137 TaxID=712531 RepID=UPI0001EB2A22|nr:YraN family protein [Selenomonas sp. oral taxon 137]EFR40450.1 TIGR00252 family protein [Selenomonas sp. oral taxon 137 str. F0430]